MSWGNLTILLWNAFIYMWFHVPDTELFTLQQASTARLQQAYRPGTRINQLVQIRRYYAFCRRYHLTDINPSPTQLTMYLEYLAQHLKSPQSVKNYLSAVGLIHRQLGLQCTAMLSFPVITMLRAIQHTLRNPILPKLPVSVNMLLQMVQFCQHLGTWGRIMKCALLFSFFGFLRQSNVAPRSHQLFDTTRDTLRSDINVSSQGVTIRLKWTKTHQSSHTPVIIKLPCIQGSPLCPTNAYRLMCITFPTRGRNTPLLYYYPTVHHPAVVTTRMLAQFRKFIQRLHLPQGRFTLHSLRKGGATLCHAHGVPVDQIKTHGTWASEAVWSYINPDTAAISMAMLKAIRSYDSNN
jgi:hypothetical protein